MAEVTTFGLHPHPLHMPTPARPPPRPEPTFSSYTHPPRAPSQASAPLQRWPPSVCSHTLPIYTLPRAPLLGVGTREKTCSSDSRLRRKLSGTTGHCLLRTQRRQMLCVAAWVWFCLSTEFVAKTGVGPVVLTQALAHTLLICPPLRAPSQV